MWDLESSGNGNSGLLTGVGVGGVDVAFSRSCDQLPLNLLPSPVHFRDSHSFAFTSGGSSGCVPSPSQREPLGKVLVWMTPGILSNSSSY